MKRNFPNKKHVEIIDLTSLNDSEEEEKPPKNDIPKFDYQKIVAQLTQQEKTTNSDEFITLCKVCLTNRINQVVFPCSHACLCDQCFKILPSPKLCPVCRKPILQIIGFTLC